MEFLDELNGKKSGWRKSKIKKIEMQKEKS